MDIEDLAFNAMTAFLGYVIGSAIKGAFCEVGTTVCVFLWLPALLGIVGFVIPFLFGRQ